MVARSGLFRAFRPSLQAFLLCVFLACLLLAQGCEKLGLGRSCHLCLHVCHLYCLCPCLYVGLVVVVVVAAAADVCLCPWICYSVLVAVLGFVGNSVGPHRFSLYLWNLVLSWRQVGIGEPPLAFSLFVPINAFSRVAAGSCRFAVINPWVNLFFGHVGESLFNCTLKIVFGVLCSDCFSELCLFFKFPFCCFVTINFLFCDLVHPGQV